MMAVLALGAALAFLQQADPGRADRLFETGVALHRKGDLDGARKSYEAALAIAPGRVDILSNLGLVYGRTAEYDRAIAAFGKALSIDPGQLAVRFNLGLTYFQAERFEEARREFAQLRRREPANRAVRKMLGLALLKAGRTGDGIVELEAAEEHQPDDVELACTLVSAYVKARRLADAKRVVDMVLSRSDTAEAHFVSGSYYLAAQKYPQALEHLQRAHSIQPDLPDLKTALADAYAYNANQDLAASMFAEQLERNPKDFTANLLLGWLYLEADKSEAAAVYLSRARETRPDDADLLFQLARLAKAEGRAADSAELLERVAAAQPANRAAHVMLAQAYRKLNRPADAAREQDIVNQLNREEMTHPPPPRER